MKELLETTGVQTLETFYEGSVQLPYIGFWQSRSLCGPDKSPELLIEVETTAVLRTKRLEPSQENKVERALSAAGLSYEKNTVYDDDEGCWKITYSFRHLEKKGR